MQIYLEDSVLSGFNWQRAFETRYIAQKSTTSREHQKLDKKDMKHKDNMLAKG